MIAKRSQSTNQEDLLTPELLEETLSPQQVEAEIDNNIQGIFSYVVRWVEMGIGCSKSA